MESIKDIYSEAEQRVRVNQVQELTTTRVTHRGVTKTVVSGGPDSPGPSSPAKGKNSNKNTTLKGTTPGKSKPAINKALAEKGWVNQFKPTAHNYHLKNLQSASQAATEVSDQTISPHIRKKTPHYHDFASNKIIFIQ